MNLRHSSADQIPEIRVIPDNLPEVELLAPGRDMVATRNYAVEIALKARDDFGLPTTAFTICTFWYIDALAAVGRREEAREILEHTLSCRNHLGLLSEEIAHSGELLGNFPQAFTHIALISGGFV